MTTLMEAVAPRRGAHPRTAVAALSVVAGSLLIAGLAQLSIRLPFTPVPVTGQTLGVLLVGASLGPALGASSVLLYLAEGAAGLPFFAGGASGLSVLGLASATGGYLWGFVAAAGAVGALARRGWDRSLPSAIGAMFVGEVIIYLAGVPWLMAALDLRLERGLVLGLYPFVIGDALKLLVAAGLLPSAWKVVGRASPPPGVRGRP